MYQVCGEDGEVTQVRGNEMERGWLVGGAVDFELLEMDASRGFHI